MEIREKMIREAAGAITALRERGYSVVREEYYPQHFGNAVVLLNKGTVNMRLVRERSQWFAEVSFTGQPAEWFDSAVLFSELGAEAADPSSIDEVVEKLIATAAHWEVLFLPETYPEARQQLKDVQRKFAFEEFGYESS